MRRDCHVSLKRLCGLFGKTRHAFYEKEWQTNEDVIGHAIVFKLVGNIVSACRASGHRSSTA